MALAGARITERIRMEETGCGLRQHFMMKQKLQLLPYKDALGRHSRLEAKGRGQVAATNRRQGSLLLPSEPTGIEWATYSIGPVVAWRISEHSHVFSGDAFLCGGVFAFIAVREIGEIAVLAERPQNTRLFRHRCHQGTCGRNTTDLVDAWSLVPVVQGDQNSLELK